ncbi:unnamed protein product [Miscanthus lutarioriparius]|uniref:Sulfotransferase n=1 Tax=Miscanthus lutarioriparius TaxID=422564 RepID=A0A811Q617_9POAL|nr:unnamed protein product [Miscanthus lutarioriparius]
MSQAEELSTTSSSSEAIASESHITDLTKHPTSEVSSEPLLLYKNFWFRRQFVDRIKLLQTSPASRHSHLQGSLQPTPFSLLPESIGIHGCRILYICRDPKDAFVSRWHFTNEVFTEKADINVAFNKFCEGISGFGPYWDHCLEYWKESTGKPDRILFLKYEDMMLEPVKFVKTLASFLGGPFSHEEEDAGVAEEVVRFCSFKTLSSLNNSETDVVQRGYLAVKKSAYFRRGKVGDWVNHISDEMGRKLDYIVEEKLKGSGLVF